MGEAVAHGTGASVRAGSGLMSPKPNEQGHQTACGQNPSDSFTRTVVIRPGATALFMTRRLLTPLGTP